MDGTGHDAAASPRISVLRPEQRAVDMATAARDRNIALGGSRIVAVPALSILHPGSNRVGFVSSPVWLARPAGFSGCARLAGQIDLSGMQTAAGRNTGTLRTLWRPDSVAG